MSSETQKKDEIMSNSPYLRYASDNPRAIVSSVQLNGENYNEWLSEMLNVLQTKREMSFIKCTLKKRE